MSPYVRMVKTASGARAVQIVHSTHAGKRDIEHIGSAHDEQQLELLKAAARQRLHVGQGELELGLAPAGAARQPVPITGTRLTHQWDALDHAYQELGFDVAAGGDEVFRLLVLARIIEPTSKLDAARVLTDARIAPPSYRTVTGHLPAYATDGCPLVERMHFAGRRPAGRSRHRPIPRDRVNHDRVTGILHSLDPQRGHARELRPDQVIRSIIHDPYWPARGGDPEQTRPGTTESEPEPISGQTSVFPDRRQCRALLELDDDP